MRSYIWSKDWNVAMSCNLTSRCFLWMMPIPPPPPAGRADGQIQNQLGLCLFSQLCHYHLYLTMFRLLQPGQNYLQHLIMDALFLRERLLMARWSKLRHPSADMLWRGIENAFQWRYIVRSNWQNSLSWIYMKQLAEYYGTTTTSHTQPLKYMTAMGKVDTSDLMRLKT